MLPVLMRHGMQGIGRADTGGKVPQYSHEEREEIRSQIESLAEDSRGLNIVRQVAKSHGISVRECYNILAEDQKDPEYWEKEILLKVRLAKNP